MPAHDYADDPLAGRPQNAIATAHLIDQLPRRVTTLPLFALAVGGVGQSWQVTVTR